MGRGHKSAPKRDCLMDSSNNFHTFGQNVKVADGKQILLNVTLILKNRLSLRKRTVLKDNIGLALIFLVGIFLFKLFLLHVHR